MDVSSSVIFADVWSFGRRVACLFVQRPGDVCSAPGAGSRWPDRRSPVFGFGLSMERLGFQCSRFHEFQSPNHIPRIPLGTFIELVLGLCSCCSRTQLDLLLCTSRSCRHAHGGQAPGPHRSFVLGNRAKELRGLPQEDAVHLKHVLHGLMGCDTVRVGSAWELLLMKFFVILGSVLIKQGAN